MSTPRIIDKITSLADKICTLCNKKASVTFSNKLNRYSEVLLLKPRLGQTQIYCSLNSGPVLWSSGLNWRTLLYNEF